MKLFTFSSANTRYVDLALECVRNFEKFGVEVTHICNKNCGDLFYNIAARTHAMLRLADQYPEECCGWVDADVVPIRHPDIFDQWDALSEDFDVALTHRPNEDEAHQFCAGVVLWPRGGGKGLRWLSMTLSTDPKPTRHCREQVYIGDTVRQMNMTVFNLGEIYNDPQVSDSTVIFHSTQAVKPQHDISITSYVDNLKAMGYVLGDDGVFRGKD